jgi:flagellar secretion chaperone FliS
MDAAAREQYLSSQVFTATPERLHLMLIGGAIRYATLLRDAIVAGDIECASIAGEKCRDILSEMLLCVQRDAHEAAKRVRSIYTFLIREVADAQIRRESGRMEGVLKVLEIERDTWTEVCEKAGPREFRRDDSHPNAATIPSLEPPVLPSESFSFQA